MKLRILAFCTVWCFCAVYAVCAQDPFDDFDAPADQNLDTFDASRKPAGAAATSEVDVRERDAVVLSLRNNPPKDPIELARAIQLMVRIRRWDEVGRWLDQLGKLQLDANTAVSIVETAGSKTFLDIETKVSSLSDDQREIARRIRDAAASALQDPKSLAQRVEQLRSESKGDRLSGFEALKASGAPGITAMLNAVMSEKGNAPNSSMVEAFSLLGDHATRAWQVAMTTPHADARQRLVELVSRAPKPNMGCELMAALHDSTLDDTAKEPVNHSLAARKHVPPTAEQVHRFAMLQVDRSLGVFQQHAALNEVDTELMWRLSTDGRSVVEGASVPALVHLARASQAGQVALRMIPASDVASATAIAAHWEFLAANGAANITSDSIFQNTMPPTLRDSYEFASLIWDAATTNKLTGAQALAISNLSRWEGLAMPVPVRERLVAAMKSGHPMVRYPAATALMKTMLERAANPDADQVKSNPFPSGFDGSSRIAIVGREMQQMSSDPTVLIIGGNSGLRSHTHGLIHQFGYRFFEAASVTEVFALLRSSLPIEGIFIVDHLRDLDLGQTIQRIRANPSTSRVPIAILADSLSSGEHAVAAADPHVLMASVPPTTEGLGDIIRRMMLLADRPNLDPESRILFKESANGYFQTLHPEQRKSVSRGQDVLYAATREEQQNLLRIAADETELMSKREQASQIFVQSVRRFGLLITSETADAQYDVYNERGEFEPVTRAVMGRILDAIEAGGGQRSWAEKAP